jgi:hypothetical protein
MLVWRDVPCPSIASVRQAAAELSRFVGELYDE